MTDRRKARWAAEAGALVTTGAFEYAPENYSPTDLGRKDPGEYDRTNLATILGMPPTCFTRTSGGKVTE